MMFSDFEWCANCQMMTLHIEYKEKDGDRQWNDVQKCVKCGRTNA